MPLAVRVTSAKVSEGEPVILLVDSIKISMGKPGQPRSRPIQLTADKGYDSRWLRPPYEREGSVQNSRDVSGNITAKQQEGS